MKRSALFLVVSFIVLAGHFKLKGVAGQDLFNDVPVTGHSWRYQGVKSFEAKCKASPVILFKGVSIANLAEYIQPSPIWRSLQGFNEFGGTDWVLCFNVANNRRGAWHQSRLATSLFKRLGEREIHWEWVRQHQNRTILNCLERWRYTCIQLVEAKQDFLVGAKIDHETGGNIQIGSQLPSRRFVCANHQVSSSFPEHQGDQYKERFAKLDVENRSFGSLLTSVSVLLLSSRIYRRFAMLGMVSAAYGVMGLVGRFDLYSLWRQLW